MKPAKIVDVEMDEGTAARFPKDATGRIEAAIRRYLEKDQGKARDLRIRQARRRARQERGKW